MLFEFEAGRCNGKTGLARGHGGEALALADAFGQVFAALFLHERFGIKQVHL